MLNKLAQDIHENAVDHGWWDEPRSFGEVVALCHSELSEALEEYRAGKQLLYYSCRAAEAFRDGSVCDNDCSMCADGKPEGVAVEMADCLIRILDWFGYEELDVEEMVRIKHQYNRARPYRHGGQGAVRKGHIMKSGDRETIQRALGIIEGIACVAQDNAGPMLITAVEMIEEVLDSDGPGAAEKDEVAKA